MNTILEETERQKEIEIIEAIEKKANVPKRPVGRPRIPEEQKRLNRNKYENDYQNLKYKMDPVYREMKKKCCLNYLHKKKSDAGIELKRVGRPSKTIEEKKARQKEYYLMRKTLKIRKESNEPILESQDQEIQFQNQNQMTQNQIMVQ